MSEVKKIKGNPRRVLEERGNNSTASPSDTKKVQSSRVSGANNPRLKLQQNKNSDSPVLGSSKNSDSPLSTQGKNSDSPYSSNPKVSKSANSTSKALSNSLKSRSVTSAKKLEKSARKKEKENAAKKRRETKKPRRISTFGIVISVVVVLIVGLIAAYFICANTNVFVIQDVEYVGADHLTKAELEALSHDVRGQSLLSFDRRAIEKGLTRTSWIQGVNFSLRFPHKLTVNIQEREIGAVVDFAQGANQTSQSWIITRDGTWIMAVPNEDTDTAKAISPKIFEDAKSAIHITDVPNGVSPEIGKKSTDDTVLNALSIITGFTTSLKSDVKSIKASSVSATTIELSNNIEVAFGSSDQIRDKERIISEIIQQQPKVVFINVRTPERPTWRAA